jgi:hypothetical protein
MAALISCTSGTLLYMYVLMVTSRKIALGGVQKMCLPLSCYGSLPSIPVARSYGHNHSKILPFARHALDGKEQEMATWGRAPGFCTLNNSTWPPYTVHWYKNQSIFNGKREIINFEVHLLSWLK